MLLNKVGASAKMRRERLVGVIKRCVIGNTETLTSENFDVGHSLGFRVAQVEAERVTVEVSATIGEQTGTGTYLLDGCEATGPIVRTITNTLVYDLKVGQTKVLPIGNGYTLQYTVERRD